MFAKQTVVSASLVALCGAAAIARAEDESSAQSEGEAWVNDGDDDDELAPMEPRELPHEPLVQPIAKPSGRFLIGAGYSDYEGFLASAEIVQPDLFRTGSLLAMSAHISAKRQLFLTRFADPDVFGSRLGLSVDVYNDMHTLPGFSRHAAGGALTLAHPFGNGARAFVSYRVEDVKVAALSETAARSNIPDSPLTGGLLSALKAGVVYDTLDHRYAPTRGTQLGGSIEIGDRQLGSDIEFVRSDAWVQHHQPIGGLTLHLSGSFTTISGPGGGAPPRSERLFLMSGNEIRGYHPDSFGPISALGTPLGGDAKLLGSAELEVPLVRRIGLSAIGFADAGALVAQGQGQVGRSVGVGLLWRSPIGPLKFSWALPLDGGKPAFVFGLGM
jgi:outer membrane protein insertion porin family